jgi:hypothetical protein
MVKDMKKAHNSLSNIIINNVPESKTPPKSRQQIYQTNYQKNKERKKAQRKERYAAQKKQSKLTQKKYYQTSSIRILMSLKEYTELNKEKQKLWLDLAGTLQDLNDKGIFDIIQIMKLRASAENLIKDYWETAQKEIRKGKSWNSLSEQQQERLIRYWSNEKARQASNLNQELAALEKQGQTYQKELELAKFHEERGKKDCQCWQCQGKKELQAEITEQVFSDYEKANQIEKEQCPECQKWVKELDEENGVCQKCVKNYSD